MEERRELIIKQKHIPRIMTFGLVISALLIIFSVESLYRSHKYQELGIATGVFFCLLLMIRWFK
jgi:hypothetical protein